MTFQAVILCIAAGVAAATGILTLAYRALRRVHQSMNQHDFICELRGTPTERNPQGGPSIIEKVDALSGDISDVRALVEELVPNGGASFRDEYRQDMEQITAAIARLEAKRTPVRRRK